MRPTFVSVAYGAGGATRDRTVAITRRIAQETPMLPMAHLTCVGHTTRELAEIVRQLSEAWVRNVLALRGDPPGGAGAAGVATPGGGDYASARVAVRNGGSRSPAVSGSPAITTGSSTALLFSATTGTPT